MLGLCLKAQHQITPSLSQVERLLIFHTSEKMAERCVELPDECWEMIFCLLDHHQHLEAPSLVSKRFLSITNCLRLTLTVADQTVLVLSRLFKRFPHLKKIDLRDFHGDLDGLVHQIARSRLNLEELNLSNQKNLPVQSLSEFGSNMKSLKVLKCSRLCFLQDSDLNAVANLLPWLEELDISYPENDYGSMHDLGLLMQRKGAVTDAGIELLSSKLSMLRKIDVSGNQFISDRSLVALSSNCVLLREIAVRDCCFISQSGIGFVLSHSPNLISVSVYGIETPSSPTSSPPSPTSSPPSSVSLKDTLVDARALCALDFSYSYISDDFLYSIAEAHLPLKEFKLFNCYNFTFSGLLSLLYRYQSLSYLALERVDFLTDQCMNDLSRFLCNVTSINLNFCSKLTNSTFFTLIKDCPSLNHIEMERTNLGKEDCTMDFVMNPQVKSLKLARNAQLSNECLRKFASACPELQVLDVSHCSAITEEGLAEILRKCCKIRHLEVNRCGGMKKIGIDSDFCKLEVLRSQGLGINDEALVEIGKRCRGLLHLDLEGCLNVTARGVKEVVQKCRGLREINLKYCDNVNVDIVAWMVFSRPSLRKITPPCGFVPSESQRNLFLRHGCVVSNG